MDISKQTIITAEAKIDRSHYKTAISVDDHVIITDEPLHVGGADLGVSPQGMLLSSIGGCTAITLRMYIDRKMWNVDSITVGVVLDKGEEGSSINLQLSFEGDLTEEQRHRLVQIANACPIHKLLTGNLTIDTSLK